MLSKCCCICFKSLYISLLCSQLHKYKLIVIYLSSENVKGLKDCFQACFSSKSYVSRLFGCLFLPPTAPNCENVQSVKCLYCPLWVCFRCCILSFGGSLWLHAGGSLGIWFMQRTVKVGSFLFLCRQNIAVSALNRLVCPLIADSEFTLGECQRLKRLFSRFISSKLWRMCSRSRACIVRFGSAFVAVFPLSVALSDFMQAVHSVSDSGSRL